MTLPLCQLDGTVERRAGGNADGDAFPAGQQLRGFKRFVGRGGEHFVIDLRVQHVRHEAGADALDLVGARAAFGQDRGVLGH